MNSLLKLNLNLTLKRFKKQPNYPGWSSTTDFLSNLSKTGQQTNL